MLPSGSLPASSAPISAATTPAASGTTGSTTLGSTSPASTAAGSTSSPGSTAGQVPAGLTRFYGQHLAWTSCVGYATTSDAAPAFASPVVQCARMTVPLAYADPSGPTVQVAVLRKVATDPAARIGSLVTDPGGPGGSGTAFLASYVTTNDTSEVGKTVAALNKRFDLVGIDPRGVGSSLPAVQCQTDAEKDASRAMDTRSRNAADVSAANAQTQKEVDECFARTGKAQGIDGKTFLANVGTRDVARDLDVLRAVLGDAKLSYLGFSYGTEIGWEYAEQFPTHVRAILFDGDVSPVEDPFALAIGQQAGFQSAFENFARWCAASSPGCALGTDPNKALGAYQALVRPLLDHHLTVGDGRQLSFDDAVTGTIVGLYYTQFRDDMARGLLNLKAGNGDVLMALADIYDERDATGHYSNEGDAFNAVRCVDGPRMTDPAAVTKFNAQYAAAGPFAATGDPAGAVLDICALWPVPPTLQPHQLKITGLPKTLVISTTGDPATPYADGVELAKEIGATLLTVKAVRHTSYLTNDDQCTDDIGTAYLTTLAQPAAGTTCG